MDSQDKKILAGGVAIVLILMIAAAVYLRKKPPVEAPPPEPNLLTLKQFDFDLNDSTPCPGPEIKYKMVDGAMTGIIERGQEVSIVLNYFKCNEIKKDQVVLYRFSKGNDPVLRRVVAVEGDTFKLQKNTKQKAWNLLINGEVMKDQDQQPFGFGNPDIAPPLSLYEKPRKGVLAKDEVIVFCSQAPSERDSGTFGLTAKSDMIGLVQIPKE